MENRGAIKTRFIILLTFVIVVMTVSTCFAGQQWILFHDNEIKGSVVDAETSKPIEDAIVIGMWALTQVPGEGFGGYAKIQVATTDREGNFAIPSWTTFKPWKLLSVTHGLAPKIIIYKPGHRLYWSTKIGREGFPDHYEITEEDKKKIKEKYSLVPAKLKRTYTDEEIWENFSEFESERAAYEYYTKRQLRDIFDAIEKGTFQLPVENKNAKEKILKDIDQYKRYWMEDKR